MKEYLIILLGSVIYAVAFDWLFVPNNIVMGGFTGLAQTLNHYIPVLPIGVVVIVLNAAIAMYVSSAAMDTVIYGRKTSKVACIVCSNGSELMKDLIQMDLGITEIKAKGGFSGEDKKVLICAFKPNRIAILKKAVIQKDPHAFVIVCDAQDVYGEGFAECMLNSI